MGLPSTYPTGTHTHTQTHTRLTALCPGLPRWAGTRKVKPIWILLKQETVSSSDISRATCKSAHRSRQITTPAPYHSVFYRPDALPAAQPTVSKHWKQSKHWRQQSVIEKFRYLQNYGYLLLELCSKLWTLKIRHSRRVDCRNVLLT